MKFLNRIVPENVKKAIKQKLGVPSLVWSLNNLKKNGFNPTYILDIGAYEGHWTKETMKVYPNADYLMIEAQSAKKPHLNKIHQDSGNADYAIALLGSASDKIINFLENETSSHVVSENVIPIPVKEIKCTTLDNIILEKGGRLPDLIKIDVQGYELEVLRGGQRCLNNAEVCLLEVSLFTYGVNDPLIYDVLKFMNENNFQSYDISQFMRRPYDHALHQIDMFFVKKDSKLIASKNW